MLKKITSIVCIVLGVITIILGATIAAEPADHSVEENTYRYSAAEKNLPSATFGADFYTYIYQGSDYIVDILNDINQSMETVVKAEDGIYNAAAAGIEAADALIDTVYKVGSTIVIAIGLMILSLGIISTGTAFTKPAPVVLPAAAASFSREEGMTE